MAAMTGVPYWRLGGFYFFYFAVVGVISPYWGLYLDHLGFAASQIGVMVAAPMITRMLAPNVWGWLADRSGRYLTVIRFGAVGAVLGFVGVLFRTDFWGLLAFTILFTFFWNAVLPQFEVVTLDALGANSHRYSRIRLWGSIGFIVAVVSLGVIFHYYSIAQLPWLLWFCLAMIAVVTFTVPPIPHRERPSMARSIWQNLRSNSVLSFLLAAFFLHMSHGVFYGFYSLFLAQYQYSSVAIGLLWAVGVVAEIWIFLKVPGLLQRFSLRHCYLVSILAAVARWFLIGCYPEVPIVLVFAQILHALTFGVAHAVAIDFVRRNFDALNRGKGQALYSAFCFGGGGAMGAWLSGLFWNLTPVASFAFASFAAALAFGIAYWGMERRIPPRAA